MASGVFVLKVFENLVAMQPANFATEDDFQRLLADFPALPPGDQIDGASPRRWLLISREKSIPRKMAARPLVARSPVRGSGWCADARRGEAADRYAAPP